LTCFTDKNRKNFFLNLMNLIKKN